MFKKSPALFLLIFVFVGILIADSFRISISIFFFALIVSIITALFCLKSQKNNLVVLFVALGLMSFVGLRFASLYYETSTNHISHFIDAKTNYTLYGEIVDWPELKLERTELTVAIDSMESSRMRYVEGKILLKINMPTTKFQKGDKLVFQGRVYPVEGERFSKEFNYNRFLRYKEITGVVYLTTPLNVLYDKANSFSVIPLVDNIRDAIKSSFKRNLSPVSSALASGFLIGETRDIPPELYKRFKDSGTLHLLAVSGSNVILVLTFFSFLFKPLLLSKAKRSLLLIGVVFLFSLLSYGEPSVVRASVMATFVLLAHLFERRYELKNIIAVAALMILLYAPSQLFDIGFQLSFVIAWGLIPFVPMLNKLFDKYSLKKWYTFLLFPFLVSLTAQLFSIGLIGLYFKQIPLLSPIANLFVVPIVSIAVIAVLVLLVADLILPILGIFFGSILNLFLEFTVSVVNVFGSDSMPMVQVFDWTIFGVCCLYLVLFMIPTAMFSKASRRAIVMVVFILLNVFVLKQAVAYIDKTETIDISCSSIPGGVMAIVPQNNNQVDIIINGIKGKKYNIDEKIISPKLEHERIEKVNKLIILKSDFSGLDDLLRLAEKYKVDKIYVPQKLTHSVYDQIHNSGFNFLPTQIEVLSKTESRPDNSGYINDDYGFSLVTNSVVVTFVDVISPKHLSKFSDPYKHFLVIGSNWNLSMQDYSRFSEIGYEKIICAKLHSLKQP